MIRVLSFGLVATALAALPQALAAAAPGKGDVSSMTVIPSGSYLALYGRPGDQPIRVKTFRLDRDAVTRAQYLEFVRANPQWRRSAVKSLFADREGYLSGWTSDLGAGRAADLSRPVSGVSWFAAKAYCTAQGKRLPTVAEWEYAAAASETMRDASRDATFVQRLVSLYATARSTRSIDEGFRNVYGVRGLHGLVWEWTSDFNSVLVSDDSRGAGARDHDLYCASAAIGSTDPGNYAAFLRYAIRAGLTGRNTLESLGFRCAA
jgi:formylglycine-generating enzyme